MKPSLLWRAKQKDTAKKPRTKSNAAAKKDFCIMQSKTQKYSSDTTLLILENYCDDDQKSANSNSNNPLEKEFLVKTPWRQKDERRK